jgi:hypothetical protein
MEVFQTVCSLEMSYRILSNLSKKLKNNRKIGHQLDKFFTFEINFLWFPNFCAVRNNEKIVLTIYMMFFFVFSFINRNTKTFYFYIDVI